MLHYILRRVLQLIPVVIGVTFIVFALTYIAPGDPARLLLPQDASDEDVAEMRSAMGHDRPMLVQYFHFLFGYDGPGDSFDYKGLLRLDLGRSYVSNRPVFGTILDRFPNTALLAVIALVLSIVVSIPFGIISATRPYSKTDMVVTVLALLGISMPAFWLGMMLIWIFSVQLRLFPSLASPANLISLVLPAITLAAMSTAVQTRMTRSSMMEVIRQDYIRTARAKGLSEKQVIRKHALRNALIPVVTVIGLQVGNLMVGSVMTETVFSYPGIGTIMVDAIQRKDNPQILASVVFMALVFAVVNLLVDILYAFIDPRIKAQYEGSAKKKKGGFLNGFKRTKT
ncbi:ABC transporter permease [Breznakiella homolactica]|uniref:ABC transporter permease n=1 Tax=Breznakiella homolactica TaxID=2798577 RepID=A0A7T8BB61_9SPIR|nr:ABC transporter permease [Breznakiella homolactica]QQO08898.1 ABC transporter permease [Breznakiella homolactica]